MGRLEERHAGLAHQPVGKIGRGRKPRFGQRPHTIGAEGRALDHPGHRRDRQPDQVVRLAYRRLVVLHVLRISERQALPRNRSEEHTSELQSLMRISYAVFCLKKKITHYQYHRTTRERTSASEKNTHKSTP